MYTDRICLSASSRAKSLMIYELEEGESQQAFWKDSCGVFERARLVRGALYYPKNLFTFGKGPLIHGGVFFCE